MIKYIAVSRHKVLWFNTLEDVAKYFNVTMEYLKLWVGKPKALNGWVIKEVNYDIELERL